MRKLHGNQRSTRRSLIRTSALSLGAVVATVIAPKSALAYECFACHTCYTPCYPHTYNGVTRYYRNVYRCVRGDGSCFDECAIELC